MSLDVTACLKALSSAFCQYRSHTTDHNIKDLERQIDVSCYILYVLARLEDDIFETKSWVDCDFQSSL